MGSSLRGLGLRVSVYSIGVSGLRGLEFKLKGLRITGFGVLGFGG